MNSKDKKLCHFVLYLDSLEGVVGRWMGGGGTVRVACVHSSPLVRKNWAWYLHREHRRSTSGRLDYVYFLN